MLLANSLWDGHLMSMEAQFLLFLAVWLSAIISVAWWVKRDASSRGSEYPTILGSATAVFAPFAIPVYFYYRTQLGERAGPPTRWDRVLGTCAAATLLAFLAGSILSPPDPGSQILYVLGSLLVAVPMAYLLVYRDGLAVVRAQLGV